MSVLEMVERALDQVKGREAPSSRGYCILDCMTGIVTPDDLAAFTAALAGQYDVLREIGRGGMGVVYLANDPRLDRPVAIKTLPPHLAHDPVVRERFLREARTAGALSHQNIVPIHRADDIAGRVFVVMGYVDGQSIAQQIRARGRLDARQIVHVLIDVASALAYAHGRGVIHRDVKAENILIDGATGRAMVTDFGIARLAEATPLTSTGQVLGTVYYLSPEQISGDTIDARSDIYSLGVVGFYALTGRFPFEAELASAVLIAHVNRPAPPVRSIAPHVPVELAAIIDRCLSKRPDARFANCRELAGALGEVEGKLGPAAFATAETNIGLALLSDTEAQAIWRRAADLQAQTGVEPRPAPIMGKRDADLDASRTSGYRITDVKDAAVEAGIAEKYVAHALVEHGVSSAPVTSAQPITVVDRGADESAMSGGRGQLEYEIVVDGEMPEADFDLLLDIIRHGIKEPGTLAAVGRSFAWQSDPRSRNLQVSVLLRGGKTTIRVSENLRSTYGGLFGVLVGGIGAGTATIFLGIGIKTHDPILAISMWLSTITLGYASARGLFGRASRGRDKELRNLAESLADQARESISQAAPTSRVTPPNL